MQQVAILGATGSIGKSTLDVIARHPDRFKVHVLTANTAVDELAALCRQFRPRIACISNENAAIELRRLIQDSGLNTEILTGPDSLVQAVIQPEVDCVVAAIVGAAGLAATLAAANAGKRILLANKEALVMAGPIFMDAVRASGSILLPIDSEHNAIFQCLPYENSRTLQQKGVRKVVLTASGGPFRQLQRDELSRVTPD